MQRRLLLMLPLILVGLLCQPLVHAVEFIASVDKTRGSIEDYFQLTLTVNNYDNATRPQVPSSSDFQIQYLGQSSKTQWINGETSSQIDFNYHLIPLKTGRLTIPAVSIDIEDRQFRSEPIHLHVSQVSETPLEQKLAFVRQFLSLSHAYPGQQLLYTFELYIRQGLQVRNLNFTRPDFNAFQVKESAQKESVIKNMGGLLFEIYTVQLILFPHKTGNFDLHPATLDGQRVVEASQKDPVFKNLRNSILGGQLHSFQLRTKPLSLDVLPIPANSQPEGFYGLVGEFDIQANLSQAAIKVGESATLTITISGSGPPEMIQKPEISLEENLKIYEDQPIVHNELEGNRQIGKAVFVMALVPHKTGTIAFPPLSISFFNPQTQSFETARADIPPISVIAGEAQELRAVGGTAPQAQKHVVKRLGEDLLPVHQDIAALQNSKWGVTGLLIYGSLFFLGPLGFAGGWLWKWKIERSTVNQDKIRSQQAFPTFRKTVKQLYEKMPDNQIFAEALMKALKNYVGDKTGKNGEALTSREISMWLSTKDMDAELIQQWNDLLERCEMTQYAASSLAEDGKEKIYRSSQEIVKHLETQLK